MQQFIFKTTEERWNEAHSTLFSPDGKENAGVFLCGKAEAKNEFQFLAQRFVPVPKRSYIERKAYHLEVAPGFYNSIVDLCLKGDLAPVIVHSHPTAKEAWYSGSDDFGESKLLPVLHSLLPGSRVGSLVVTPTACMGRIWEQGQFAPINQVKIVGSKLQIFNLNTDKLKTGTPEIFERQVRAVGQDGQRLLQSLKVAVIGVGGTGSTVAEMLGRLGVSDIAIVDDDRIEESNLTRIYGSFLKDVGRPKTEVIREHLEKLGVKNVVAIHESAIKQDVLLKLRDRDVVMSCVDNDRTRAILNKFAHQYLIPVIDIGVRLDARNGKMQGAAGRITVVGPGETCLRCSHHLNPERIRAESMSKVEREGLQKEGYIMGIDEPAPSVISLNTTVAGVAVTALLNMVVDLTGSARPSGQLYDASSGTMFTAKPIHDEKCDVCSGTGVEAKGDGEIVSAYN